MIFIFLKSIFLDFRPFEKIDFIWINREYESFEWFMNLLAELKIQQSLSKTKFFNTHLYWTDKNNTDLIAMEKFNEILSSIPDSPVKNLVEDMFLSIKKGRPDFSDVYKIILILDAYSHSKMILKSFNFRYSRKSETNYNTKILKCSFVVIRILETH